MSARPILIDLYAGLGGWAEGFLAEGWRVIGFDIERHDYGSGGYPGQLVLADVRTLHGSQFRHADCIVASPPCQEYSYMAMPWTRAKAKRQAYLDHPETQAQLTELFDACFRIQREACEAAGRHIPMVVENVKGAQPWVGRAKWHYGSYYLWGDVPAIGQPGNPVTSGLKTIGHANKRDGFSHTRHLTNQRESDAVKQPGHSGRAWFDAGFTKFPSRSNRRKAASAQIAKIPFELARWIARVYDPQNQAKLTSSAR